jgi:hypothetical protein
MECLVRWDHYRNSFFLFKSRALNSLKAWRPTLRRVACASLRPPHTLWPPQPAMRSHAALAVGRRGFRRWLCSSIACDGRHSRAVTYVAYKHDDLASERSPTTSCGRSCVVWRTPTRNIFPRDLWGVCLGYHPLLSVSREYLDRMSWLRRSAQSVCTSSGGGVGLLSVVGKWFGELIWQQSAPR